MNFEGQNMSNIHYYSRDTWGMCYQVTGVCGIHYQSPTYLEYMYVWVEFTVIGKE